MGVLAATNVQRHETLFAEVSIMCLMPASVAGLSTTRTAVTRFFLRAQSVRNHALCAVVLKACTRTLTCSPLPSSADATSRCRRCARCARSVSVTLVAPGRRQGPRRWSACARRGAACHRPRRRAASRGSPPPAAPSRRARRCPPRCRSCRRQSRAMPRPSGSDAVEAGYAALLQPSRPRAACRHSSPPPSERCSAMVRSRAD
eukprot:1959567-Pleurochrysis_carterae.AAC.2